MATASKLLHEQAPATAAEDLAARLIELVSIRSVSRGEQALCSLLEQRLRATAGLDVVRTGDNLIVTLPALAGRPRLILCGHLDTVPENQNLPPTRDGDKIAGLGTSDLKSGLAVLLRLLDELSAAIAARAAQPVDCDPAFVFYAREEIAFKESGLNEVERDWPALKQAEFAVCVEPTANAVELGCNGTMHAELTVLGKAAHAARPWLGSNAIHSALSLMAAVANRPERAWSPAGRRDIRYREVMSVTGVNGGKARNVIPDRCTFNVNFRFAPDRTPDGARAEITSLFADAIKSGTAELVFKDLAPAGRVPAANRWCDRLTALAKNEVRAKQAWTDVGRFSDWNIDAVSCGPGFPEVAHQKDEWASVEKMVESLAMFRGLVGLARTTAPEGANPHAPKGAAPHAPEGAAQ